MPISEDLELECEHGLSRKMNCYSCFLDFYYKEKREAKTSEFDALHKTISELKIRISKLEQYQRLQDDFQNDQASVNTIHMTGINSLSEAVIKLESQIFVPFDEYDYDDEIEPPVILGENVRFVGNITIPKETLCMDKFTKPKTTGLTFEEAIVAFKALKRIRRQSWSSCFSYCIKNDCLGETVSFGDMLENDWEIVE